ncbi:MAG TPA: MmoB/DmpM family protein [Polyangiaceae bacterium]|nr:MmoB/DmpM family protein [Polyangiaceae bacterium]
MTVPEGTTSSAAGQAGPVLEKGEVADAIIAAIQQLNANVRVIDRDSYWRVLVSSRCVITRDAVESALGRPFLLPGDLELYMPSFSGRFLVDSHQAIWEAGGTAVGTGGAA